MSCNNLSIHYCIKHKLLFLFRSQKWHLTGAIFVIARVEWTIQILKISHTLDEILLKEINRTSPWKRCFEADPSKYSSRMEWMIDYWKSFRRMAFATASVLQFTCSLVYIFLIWVRVVSMLILHSDDILL